MKNMKISMKLILAFAIVIVLAISVGVVGIVGMLMITEADTQLYVVQTKPLPDIAKTLEYSQRLRIQLRNAIIYSGQPEKLATVESEINDRMQKFEVYSSAYDATIVDAEARKLFDEAIDLYNNQYKPGMQKVLDGAKNSTPQLELIAIMDEIGAATNQMVDNFSECMEIKVEAASAASDANDALSYQLLTIIIAVLAVAVAVAMALAVYISRLISKPTLFMKDVLARIGTKGDLDFTEAEKAQIKEYSAAKDEVGESIGMTMALVNHLIQVGKSLESIANGDLTADVVLLSDRDTMGISTQKMIRNLNNMFTEINTSTAQVSSGAKQIADGAQSLAQGSTQQAAAVEQLSSSISEIADKTKENAGMADNAANLAGTIMKNAEKGNRQMDEMMSAVKEINEASQSINKVIKVIDDIAFQTNILALNAAVEAARAGQHGKGFAVVAEEVRNLAAKSAEAAKDTGSLIANSMEKAELGARIADETAASLADIVAGIGESSRLVRDIAKSSEEQSLAIAQINKGIDQVAQVVQQNSATAEESAAASEEMSGQSNMLEELITQFKLKDDHRRPAMTARTSPAPQKKQLVMPEKNTYTSGETGGFGKY